MSAWAQVDAFHSAAQVRVLGVAREWRAFARLASGSLRFRARAGGAEIKMERPCAYHPGKWRAAGTAAIRGFAEMTVDRQAAAAFAGKYHYGPTVEQARAVLVAYDAWLEAGAPRMSRPTVIP